MGLPLAEEWLDQVGWRAGQESASMEGPPPRHGGHEREICMLFKFNQPLFFSNITIHLHPQYAVRDDSPSDLWHGMNEAWKLAKAALSAARWVRRHYPDSD